MLCVVSMSRIGNKPIEIPSGVEVQINGQSVTVKGPKGSLSMDIAAPITAKVEGNVLTCERPNDSKSVKALHGLSRSLVANMVEGVSKGFEKNLELQGVGYRAQLQGQALGLSLGFSHPVTVEPPEGISFEVDKKQTLITVRGIDKQVVGQVAANVRAWRPVEPYKGKGVRYQGERVIRKAGKSVGGK